MTEINECLSNPCRNNASCIDQINGYLCACPKSFLGAQCEHKVTFRRKSPPDFIVSFVLEIPRGIRIFLSLCHLAWCRRSSTLSNYSIDHCHWSYTRKSSISRYLSSSIEWKRSKFTCGIQYDLKTTTRRTFNLTWKYQIVWLVSSLLLSSSLFFSLSAFFVCLCLLLS